MQCAALHNVSPTSAAFEDFTPKEARSGNKPDVARLLRPCAHPGQDTRAIKYPPRPSSSARSLNTSNNARPIALFVSQRDASSSPATLSLTWPGPEMSLSVHHRCQRRSAAARQSHHRLPNPLPLPLPLLLLLTRRPHPLPSPRVPNARSARLYGTDDPRHSATSCGQTRPVEHAKPCPHLTKLATRKPTRKR